MWNRMTLTIQIQLDIQKWEFCFKNEPTHFVACNCVPQKMPLQDSNSTQAYNLCLLEWRWVSRPARVRNKDRSDFDKYCPQKIRQYWNTYIFHMWFSNWIPSQNLVSRTKNSLDKELTWKMLLRFLPCFFKGTP